MLNNGRATIHKSATGLSISIPSKKNWFALLFGTAWLGAWAMGFFFASGHLFSGRAKGGPDIFLTFWLIAWTVGGIAVISMLLWGYFGQEKLLSDKRETVFEKSVFGIGLKKRLITTEVKNFRTENIEISNFGFGSNRWGFWGLGPGRIKFDYGFKTYSFGLAVDEAEAEHMVGILSEHFNS